MSKQETKQIDGGKRCAIRKSQHMDDWWIAYSPPNENGYAEGTFGDWVELADAILEERDGRRKTKEEAEVGENPAYPNGRCPTCGFGLPENGVCENVDCSAAPTKLVGVVSWVYWNGDEQGGGGFNWYPVPSQADEAFNQERTKWGDDKVRIRLLYVDVPLGLSGVGLTDWLDERIDDLEMGLPARRTHLLNGAPPVDAHPLGPEAEMEREEVEADKREATAHLVGLLEKLLANRAGLATHELQRMGLNIAREAAQLNKNHPDPTVRDQARQLIYQVAIQCFEWDENDLREVNLEAVEEAAVDAGVTDFDPALSETTDPSEAFSTPPMIRGFRDLAILQHARSLATEDDSNPEYDRALTELVVEVLGLTQDDKSTIHRLITGRELT